MGPMSLHHDKVKQLAAASHGACSSQAAGCDSCVGAVPEGGPALLLGELSAQLTERSTSPMRRGFGAPYYCNRDPLRIKRVALWATPTKSQPGDKSFTVCDLVHKGTQKRGRRICDSLFFKFEVESLIFDADGLKFKTITSNLKHKK